MSGRKVWMPMPGGDEEREAKLAAHGERVGEFIGLRAEESCFCARAPEHFKPCRSCKARALLREREELER